MTTQQTPFRIYVSKRSNAKFPEAADGKSIDTENEVFVSLKDYKKIGHNNLFEVYELKAKGGKK